MNPLRDYIFNPPIADANGVYQVLRGDFYWQCTTIPGGGATTFEPRVFNLDGTQPGTPNPDVGHVSELSNIDGNNQFLRRPANVNEQKICPFINHRTQAGLQGGTVENIIEPNTDYPKCVYKRDLPAQGQQGLPAEPYIIVTPGNNRLYNTLKTVVNDIPEAAINAFITDMNTQEAVTLFDGTGGPFNIPRIQTLHPLMISMLLENPNVIGNDVRIDAILNGLTPIQHQVMLRYNMSHQLVTQYLRWMNDVEQTRDPRAMASLASRLLSALYLRSVQLDGLLRQAQTDLEAAQQPQPLPAGALNAAGAQQLQQQVVRLQARIGVLIQEKAETEAAMNAVKAKLADYKYFQDTIFNTLQNIYSHSKTAQIANPPHAQTTMSTMQFIAKLLPTPGTPHGIQALPGTQDEARGRLEARAGQGFVFMGGTKKRKMKGGEPFETPKLNIKQKYSENTKIIEKITELEGLENISNKRAIIKNTLNFTSKQRNINTSKLIEDLFRILSTKGITSEDMQSYENSIKEQSGKTNKSGNSTNSSAVTSSGNGSNLPPVVTTTPSRNGTNNSGSASAATSSNVNASATTSSGVNPLAATSSNANTSTSASPIAAETVSQMIQPENLKTILSGLDMAMKAINNNSNIANKLKSKHKTLNETTKNIIDKSKNNQSENKITSKSKLKTIFEKYFEYLKLTKNNNQNSFYYTKYLPEIIEDSSNNGSGQPIKKYKITFKGLPENVNKEITTSLDVQKILNEVLQEMSSSSPVESTSDEQFEQLRKNIISLQEKIGTNPIELEKLKNISAQFNSINQRIRSNPNKVPKNVMNSYLPIQLKIQEAKASEESDEESDEESGEQSGGKRKSIKSIKKKSKSTKSKMKK